MKKIKYLLFVFVTFSCSSISTKKLTLDENLTYNVFVDETILQNELISSVFEEIDNTKTSTLNAQIESIIVVNAVFKFTGDIETVSGLFSNIKTGISSTASAIKAGIESGSFEVKNQLAILYDIEETFNEETTLKINSNLKEMAVNLYPLEYLFDKNQILKLDTSDKTVELFNKNLKVNDYLVDDLVPAYTDVVMNFSNLHRTVVLNKLNKVQIDSLKLQIVSKDNDLGLFENKGSIKDFITSYSKFSEITDLKKSNISSDLQFMNEETIDAVESYISSLNSKIELMVSFLGSNDLVNVKDVLVGDGPIVNKKWETSQSKIKVDKINKLLSDLSKM